MKTSKAIGAFLAKAREEDSYWAEHAKLDFSLALEAARRRAGISYKDLADKLGTSQAYVSKVFRGDANVTIETMVKFARAASGQLRIEIIDRNTDAKRWADSAAVIQASAAEPAISSHTTTTAYASSESATTLRMAA